MRGLLAATAIAACLCAPVSAFAQEAQVQRQAYDPLEGTNRHLFAAHEAIDKAVLGPVARGYRAVTPHFVRTGVSNFLHNLRSPVIFTNDVLQGEFSRAGVTAARFGVNSTVGVLGFADPAVSLGLDSHDEDFGQTLGRWGVGTGPYIFIPVLGPTNLRDGAGRIVDLAFDPLTWAHFDGDDTARVTRTVVTGLAAREDVLDEVDAIRANSIDPYVTIRSSYGLLRESAIQNGREDVRSLPNFDEIPSDSAAPAPQVTPDATPSAPSGGDQNQTPPTSAEPHNPA